MRHYIALIHKESDSDYGVSFPDLPGCVSAGSTLSEAIEMAGEALGGHLEAMADAELTLPEPSTIEAVMADPGNRDGVAVLVHAIAAPTRAVRVAVTLPEDLLAEIDRHVRARGDTRSRFLARAARRAIGSDEAA